MKEFVPLDQAGSFSSSSNLSPLAPPFKLDTSLPRPVSHSFGNIPEPQLLERYFNSDPTYVFAARPPHDNWHQMNSPNFVPNSFPNSNPSLSLSLGTNPGLPVCTAPASAGQSTTNFFSSESLGRPYHPQHSSASVQFGSAPFTAKEHDDMLLESGFAPTAQAGGLWSQNNGVELWEADFSPNYSGKVNQGKPYAGSRHTNLSVGKLSSESDENSGGVQFTTSRTSTSNPVSHKKRPYQCATSSNLSMETWSQLNPTVTSYGSHSTGFGPYKPDPSCFYPASSNLYETPSIIGNYAGLVIKTAPSSINPIEPPKNACNRKETFESQSSSSTSCIPVSAEKSDDRSGINGLVEKNNDPFINPSMSINVNLPQKTHHSVDPVNNKQVTDTLVTAETREDASFHCSSEELEQFNHGVDSPCWKGALDSRYSLFGSAEGGGSSFSIQGTQVLPVISNSAVDFSSSELQRNGKHNGENGSFPFAKQSSTAVNPSKDIYPSILDGGLDESQLSNENVIRCYVPGKTDGGSDFKSCQTSKVGFQKCNTDTKQRSCEGGIADSGKDAAKFGTTQLPYHVSERYSSLLSRDNARIDCSTTETNVESFDTDAFARCKLTSENVQSVVNLMQNLSESLLSYCSEDEHNLKERDYVVIQQIVQNLSRVGKMSSMPKTYSSLPDTTNCSEKPINAHTGTVIAQSEVTNTEVHDVQSQCYTRNACEEKKNSATSMKEGDSPRLVDEKDDSTKRIRMILEENFHEEESDMQLYKSLWLEAEAELCSQKYKERFARMKIEMEKYKKNLTNELNDVDKPPSTHVRSSMAESRNEVSVGTEIPKVPVHDHNKLNSSHTVDDASVLARFQVLKSCTNTIPLSEERQPHDSINDDSPLGTEKIVSNPTGANAEDTVVKQQQHIVVERNSPYAFFRESEAKNPSMQSAFTKCFHPVAKDPSMQSAFTTCFHPAEAKDPSMQSAFTNVLLSGRSSAGRSDGPSSGYKHLRKEAPWAWSAY